MRIYPLILLQDSSVDLKDDLIAYWSVQYPPWRRSRVYELFHCVLNVSLHQHQKQRPI